LRIKLWSQVPQVQFCMFIQKSNILPPAVLLIVPLRKPRRAYQIY